MSLPTLTTPKYTCVLPSNNKNIEYRPFLVKEEKIMLLAQESESSSQVVSAIKNVIAACTFGAIDINTLASFDLEYLFLKIRAKSVGEVADVGIACSACEKTVKISVNLDEVPVIGSIPKNSTVQLTDTVSVSLKPLTVSDLSTLSASGESEGDVSVNSIIAIINYISEGDKVYPKENSTQAELIEFVNSFSRTQLELIGNYIDELPHISHTAEYTCPHCKNKDTITLNGLQSFFA